MTNALYDYGREGFAGADIDWDGDNIKVIGVDAADYTVDLATDQNLDDVPAGARVGTTGNLAGKTITDGICDADDITMSAVSGDPFEALVIYQDSGADATSRLIGYIDTATGLTLTPNGGDVDIVFDNGANRIFKL